MLRGRTLPALTQEGRLAFWAFRRYLGLSAQGVAGVSLSLHSRLRPIGLYTLKTEGNIARPRVVSFIVSLCQVAQRAKGASYELHTQRAPRLLLLPVVLLS